MTGAAACCARFATRSDRHLAQATGATEKSAQLSCQKQKKLDANTNRRAIAAAAVTVAIFVALRACARARLFLRLLLTRAFAS